MLSDYLKKWKAYSIGCEYCNAIFRYLVRAPAARAARRSRAPAEQQLDPQEARGHAQQARGRVPGPRRLHRGLRGLHRTPPPPSPPPALTRGAQLALVIWRDRLFSKIKDRLIRALLELIQRDRDGEQVNQSEVRGVIESYGATDLPAACPAS